MGKFDKLKISLIVESHNNIIAAEMCSNENLEYFEYAFYLLLDDKKIEVQNYSNNNKVRFYILCNGKYNIVGFLRAGDEKIIKKSEDFIITIVKEPEAIINNMVINRPIPISIFGSCVSRDIFNFDLNNIFSIKTYVARQSIISAVSPPIPCNLEDINLKSKFQRESVYNDFIKNTFKLFENDGSSYILIDLIDERFNLLKYNENNIESYITYSSLLQESGYIGKINDIGKGVERKRRLLPWKEFFLDDIKVSKYMDSFCEKIVSIYSSEKIILHKGKLLNYYKDNVGNIVKFSASQVNKNKKVNELINYMYDYLEGYFGNCLLIDFCENYCADESHVWGLAPMHYQKEYYEAVFSELVKFCVYNK